jgi:fumarate reductase subunit D
VRGFLLKIEPVIWLLFGQGIMIGTMLLTGWLLVVGILEPLGVIPEAALSYDRARALATSGIFGIPIGRLLVLAIIVLPLWKGVHHIRALLVDFGGADRDPAVGGLLYALASAASIAAIVAVVRL